jgi:enoyl-CoA hydratase/carnithine racemase
MPPIPTLVDYASQGYKDIKASFNHKDAVVVVTINRAHRRNTFTHDLSDELIHIFDLVDRDDRVRAVVLTAEPNAAAYCSGADLSTGWSALKEEDVEKEGEQAHRDRGGDLTIAIYRCRKITIAAVNGHAAGIGMTALQLPFDFRIVWAGAKLVFPFVRRGIAPEAASTYLLPRLLGQSRATSLLLTGHVYTPSSPIISSLYHRILPTREEVFPSAYSFAAELAANSSQTSVAYTKALIQNGGDSVEEQHLLDSKAIGALIRRGEDAEEGVKSFKERRLPLFKDTLGEHLAQWYPWWKTVDVRHRRTKL